MDTFEERRRTQIEEARERRKASADAVPISSHARTVPGPASLGSDSTATSVPMADGSNPGLLLQVHTFAKDRQLCRSLGGLVVRRPPRERESPGIESRSPRSSHTSDLKCDTRAVTLSGARRYRVRARTGLPGVNILWVKKQV